MDRFSSCHPPLSSNFPCSYRFCHRYVSANHTHKKMNFSVQKFFSILLVQSVIFGAVFACFYGLWDFILSVMFFSLNALLWVQLVQLLISESIKETISPVVGLLFTGKTIILLCSVWFLLGILSVQSIVAGNIVAVFSLIICFLLQHKQTSQTTETGVF